MGRKKKWKECVKPRTTTINGTAVKVSRFITPKNVEVVDDNGKKTVHITMGNPSDELHDFINNIDKALNGVTSESEKETICRKFSALARDHLNKFLDVQRRYEEKTLGDYSYIDALKQKNYYREN